MGKKEKIVKKIEGKKQEKDHKIVEKFEVPRRNVNCQRKKNIEKQQKMKKIVKNRKKS